MIHLNQAIAIRSCGACQEMTREFGLATVQLGKTREGREGSLPHRSCDVSPMTSIQKLTNLRNT